MAKAKRTPEDHEARLRAMLADYPDSLAWGLDPQDRAAIRWALDELGRLRGLVRAWKPAWACERYGRPDHDWQDCPTCLADQERMLEGETDDY